MAGEKRLESPLVLKQLELKILKCTIPFNGKT
jgi:hypothetical protein